MELTAVDRLRIIVKGADWPQAEGIVVKPLPYKRERLIPYLEDYDNPNDRLGGAIQTVYGRWHTAHFDNRIKNAADYCVKKYGYRRDQIDRAVAYHKAHTELFRLDRHQTLAPEDMAMILWLLENLD